MRPTRRTCRFIFLMTFLAMPALSQERCNPEDTIASCFNRFKDAYVKSAMDQEWQKLQRQPTGVDTGGANLETNTKNLLPRMALSGLIGQSNTEDPAGTIVYDLNFLLPFSAAMGAKNAQLQAVVNTQPTISGLVRNALPANVRDDLAGKLEERLGDLADHAIRFTYDHMDRLRGRSIAQHMTVYKAMCDTAVKESAQWQKADLPKQILEKLAADFPDAAQKNAEVAFKNMPPEVATRAFALVEGKIRELADYEDQTLSNARLKSYHQLLDNQPQFHVSAAKKFRDPLIGPDELSVKVTYERSLKGFADWSTVDLNAAMSAMSNGCYGVLTPAGKDKPVPIPPDPAQCLKDFTTYVENNEEKIKDGNRLSFSGEYIESDGEMIDPDLQRIDATLPRINPITLESARKLILKAGWSRKFLVAIFGDEPVKMDLVASYEDISDDPNRQDRGIASLTFSRKMGDMEIPFGIVYANHGEFLPDTDARLSAHLGLTFKMSGRNGNQ